MITNKQSVPTHIGYILDGNRRWAKEHGLPSYEGHLAGYNALKDVIAATADAGVKYISFYTFSTENWSRAESEVKGIMRLVMQLFKTDIKQLVDEGFKLVVLGTREGLPENISKAIDEATERSAGGTRATLAMCFNYGGQQELVNATKSIIESGIPAEEVTPQVLAQHLYYPEVPPCDLVVRTSGEQRLSNFMLWRSAYSELLFLDKYWPDMRKDDVTAIIEEYKQRGRRFGG